MFVKYLRGSIRTHKSGDYGLLAICIFFAVIPGILISPFSINFFDEPYQILNAYDWKNAVYSPLSAFFGNVFGTLTDWKYLAFRYLLIFLIAFSIYIAGAFSLHQSQKKRFILLISSLSAYFATAFKSDINIYGWDHWTIPLVIGCTVTLLSIQNTWRYYKIILLGFLSAMTVMMRLPNVVMIPMCVILLCLYSIKMGNKQRLWISLLIFLTVTTLSCLIIIMLLYGSVSDYLDTFRQNPVGAHSVERLLRPLFISFLSVLRFLALMLAGYSILYLAYRKLKNSSLQKMVIVLVGFCFFILLIPLRRKVLGNVIDMGIAFTLSGILWIFVKGIKKKDFKWIWLAVTLFIMCNILVVGSNWGCYKFIVWAAIPLLALGCDGKSGLPIKSKPVKWYSCLVGFSLFAYSIFGYTRPTFDDVSINEMNYRFSNNSVLEGMYTSKTRGNRIDEILQRIRPYEELGYEILPLRKGNEYIWEYLMLEPNRFQRHKFDNWDAFNDPEYVNCVVEEAMHSKGRLIILYLRNEENSQDLMFRTLNDNLKREGEGSFFVIFTNI